MADKADLKNLITEFPKTFGKLRYGSFECGPGWYQILRDFAVAAEPLVEPSDFTIAKEKYGTLRLQGFNGPVGDLIDAAEEKSCTTCETCGRPGEMSAKGWMRTECEDCAAERSEQR